METQQKGKTLYVVLALVFVALIAGGATWFYLAGKDTSTETATDTTSTADTSVDAKTDTKTELDGSLTELDNELAAIEVDEESDDDTVDF